MSKTWMIVALGLTAGTGWMWAAEAQPVGRWDTERLRRGPKTFEAISGRPVRTRVFGPGAHPHIELAEKAELLCIAPATANILAKAAVGLADDLVSTLLLSFDGPVLMAPAMNSLMWEKPAVQRNAARLRADGVVLIDPEEGYLSCGTYGAGRMAEPEKILRTIAEELAKGG